MWVYKDGRIVRNKAGEHPAGRRAGRKRGARRDPFFGYHSSAGSDSATGQLTARLDPFVGDLGALGPDPAQAVEFCNRYFTDDIMCKENEVDLHHLLETAGLAAGLASKFLFSNTELEGYLTLVDLDKNLLAYTYEHFGIELSLETVRVLRDYIISPFLDQFSQQQPATELSSGSGLVDEFGEQISELVQFGWPERLPAYRVLDVLVNYLKREIPLWAFTARRVWDGRSWRWEPGGGVEPRDLVQQAFKFWKKPPGRLVLPLSRFKKRRVTDLKELVLEALVRWLDYLLGGFSAPAIFRPKTSVREIRLPLGPRLEPVRLLISNEDGSKILRRGPVYVAWSPVGMVRLRLGVGFSPPIPQFLPEFSTWTAYATFRVALALSVVEVRCWVCQRKLPQRDGKIDPRKRYCSKKCAKSAERRKAEFLDFLRSLGLFEGHGSWW